VRTGVLRPSLIASRGHADERAADPLHRAGIDTEPHGDLADAVAEAIAKRDPAEAETASDQLMDYIEGFTRKTIDL
jgi:hypothetical protein